MVLSTLEMLLGMVFNQAFQEQSSRSAERHYTDLYKQKKEKAAIDPHFSGKYIRLKQSLLIALIRLYLFFQSNLVLKFFNFLCVFFIVFIR